MKLYVIIVFLCTIHSCFAPSVRSKSRVNHVSILAQHQPVQPLQTRGNVISPNHLQNAERESEKRSEEIRAEVDQIVEKVVENPQFYNTQFLRKTAAVRKELLEKEGFVEIGTRTVGKSWLHMLYKISPAARYSFVCFGGWGNSKESLVPLYEMMKDQPCNIFLCETRVVDQNIFKNIWDFGIRSEQDVIDCIKKVHFLSGKTPLVLWGTCAGAFYVTRALIDLVDQQKLSAYNVAGFIFDSGWGAVDEAIVTQTRGRVKENIAKGIAPFTAHKDYRQVSQSWLARGLSALADWFINPFSWYVVKPLYGYRTYKTNILKTIEKLTIPIFFIHSYDDWVKPIADAKRLYEKAQNKTAWWIESPSVHSMHHFKHKEEYKRRCIEFIGRRVLLNNTDMV